MAELNQQGSAGVPETRAADGLGVGERAQLLHALETRFAAHLDAAGAAVREAERQLADARERLADAQQAADGERYRSDPLVFMRASVDEDVAALDRKMNPKKIRSSYRFLLDRAVELAAGEVRGFHDDQTTAQQDREHGVQACREAEQRAVETLAAAQAMQERVRSAEQAAREGLAVMLEKLGGSPE